MKQSELIIHTTVHNLKRAFYSFQLFVITLAVPALFYIGLTQNVEIPVLKNEVGTKDAKHQQVIVANSNSNAKTTASL